MNVVNIVPDKYDKFIQIYYCYFVINAVRADVTEWC